MRVLALDASDLNGRRRGGGPLLEELCDARGLSPCVGLVECDILDPRRKRELLMLRATRALEDEGTAHLFFADDRHLRARELTELCQNLLEERAQILEHNRRIAAERTAALDASGDGPRVDEAELAREGISPRLDESLQVLRSARLDAIDGALEALRHGLYGPCARCGADIAVERLRVAPDTRVCESCAREAIPEPARELPLRAHPSREASDEEAI